MLYDREALLPREQCRFLNPKDGSAPSGLAISELLKQFIAHNLNDDGGAMVMARW